MRSFLNLKLLSFAPGLDDGLVKHVSVWPAPSVPGLGGSNLLSYVYRLGSSAVAHSDYITLMRRQEQWSGGVRLLVTINMEIKTSLHPFNVSISLQIRSLM